MVSALEGAGIAVDTVGAPRKQESTEAMHAAPSHLAALV
jgi:hypothetical protein